MSMFQMRRRLMTDEAPPPEFKPLTELANFSERTPGMGGRPEHRPTDQTRALVTLMGGMGANETDISHVIGISRNTLRKHYEEELAAAPARMDYHVYSAMYKGIAKGKTDLIKLYLERRKGWKADDVDPNVNVNVSVTLSDIVKEISSKPHQLPKWKKEDFITIENERKPDAAPATQPDPTP